MPHTAADGLFHGAAKTSYQIACPPPVKITHILGLRPKLLLQIQQISSAGRPIPVLNVEQSGFYSSWVSRFLQRGNSDLGSIQISVIKMESDLPYGIQKLGHKDGVNIYDIIASMAYPKEENDSRNMGSVKINLEGNCWTVKPLSNGGYEFLEIGDRSHNTPARWALQRDQEQSDLKIGRNYTKRNQKCFNFSLTGSTTQQSPVIAWMQGGRVDVAEQFEIRMEEDRRITQFKNGPTDFAKASLNDGRIENKTISLGKLILTTSIWVTLREGQISHQYLTLK